MKRFTETVICAIFDPLERPALWRFELAQTIWFKAHNNRLYGWAISRWAGKWYPDLDALHEDAQRRNGLST